MNFLQPDFAPAYPEIFLLIMVCVVLLADLAWGKEKPHLAYLLAQLALFGCVLITFATSSPGVVYTFSGMFVDDAMADILKMMVYVTVSAVLVYSRSYISDAGMLSGEFFSLALVCNAGHDGHDFRQPFSDALPGPGTSVAVTICNGGDEAGFRQRQPRRQSNSLSLARWLPVSCFMACP